MTYCSDQCENKTCERHLINAPKNKEVSWAYFNQDLKCEDYINKSKKRAKKREYTIINEV